MTLKCGPMKDIPRYASVWMNVSGGQGAIVFEGLAFFLVALLLGTGRWNVLARRFVRLDGVARSDADVVAMLKARVLPVVEEPVQSGFGRSSDSSFFG